MISQRGKLISHVSVISQKRELISHCSVISQKGKLISHCSVISQKGIPLKSTDITLIQLILTCYDSGLTIVLTLISNSAVVWWLFICKNGSRFYQRKHALHISNT